jgi:hypothetical protein
LCACGDIFGAILTLKFGVPAQDHRAASRHMLYMPARQPLIRRWAQGMIDRSAWCFLA